jgi:hypothetical protein
VRHRGPNIRFGMIHTSTSEFVSAHFYCRSKVEELGKSDSQSSDCWKPMRDWIAVRFDCRASAAATARLAAVEAAPAPDAACERKDVRVSSRQLCVCVCCTGLPTHTAHGALTAGVVAAASVPAAAFAAAASAASLSCLKLS